MAKSKTSPAGRRNFLKSAAAGAAALVAKTPSAKAQQTEAARGAALPSASALAAETDPVSASVQVMTADHPGSDFMVDVIKALGFEYIAANPGSSFRSLHESIVNYGGNKAPELITCCHEESSVAMADGYAKVEGKPMAVMAHSTVGVQHAAVAMVRDYTKWDDLPISLTHFGESSVRAYKIAMTPPMAPVVIVADSELQE